MPLSWNEIKHRAIAFSKEWKGETREDAEAKSFWDAYFNVFGVQRRTVASFEEPVKKLSGDWGYIDLFWPGTLLAEHKSAGKDLGKAHAQGMEYVRALHSSGRGKENPRYLIVSDFQRIAIHDLEPEQDPDLPLFQRLPPSFEFPLAISTSTSATSFSSRDTSSTNSIPKTPRTRKQRNSCASCTTPWRKANTAPMPRAAPVTS